MDDTNPVDVTVVPDSTVAGEVAVTLNVRILLPACEPALQVTVVSLQSGAAVNRPLPATDTLSQVQPDGRVMESWDPSSLPPLWVAVMEIVI